MKTRRRIAICFILVLTSCSLLSAAADLIAACPCPHGCPACVGPILEHEQAYLETKSLTLALLHVLRTGQQPGRRAPSPQEIIF